MKTSLSFLIPLAAIFAGCDAQVNVPPTESKTTVVTPGEKKTEHNTTIVNPSAPAEKKTESTTVTTPGGTTTQKTTETK